MVEKVEDLEREGFKIPQENLFELFDEALGFVNNKLFNRYLMMIRNEEEYKKLEKLICYFDFDFNEITAQSQRHSRNQSQNQSHLESQVQIESKAQIESQAQSVDI
jgi:hypothetical protein